MELKNVNGNRLTNNELEVLIKEIQDLISQGKYSDAEEKLLSQMAIGNDKKKEAASILEQLHLSDFSDFDLLSFTSQLYKLYCAWDKSLEGELEKLWGRLNNLKRELRNMKENSDNIESGDEVEIEGQKRRKEEQRGRDKQEEIELRGIQRNVRTKKTNIKRILEELRQRLEELEDEYFRNANYWRALILTYDTLRTFANKKHAALRKIYNRDCKNDNRDVSIRWELYEDEKSREGERIEYLEEIRQINPACRRCRELLLTHYKKNKRDAQEIADLEKELAFIDNATPKERVNNFLHWVRAGKITLGNLDDVAVILNADGVSVGIRDVTMVYAYILLGKGRDLAISRIDSSIKNDAVSPNQKAKLEELRQIATICFDGCSTEAIWQRLFQPAQAKGTGGKASNLSDNRLGPPENR